MAKTSEKDTKDETGFKEGDYSPVQPPLTEEEVLSEMSNSTWEDLHGPAAVEAAAESGKD